MNLLPAKNRVIENRITGLFFVFPLLLLLTFNAGAQSYEAGGLIRGNTGQKQIALVFTGHEYAEDGFPILSYLSREKVQASFFLTGDFYRNKNFASLIRSIKKEGHYLGAHSDRHLLYCSWERRDSLLVTRKQFTDDLRANYAAMSSFSISAQQSTIFMPPYEWYNDTISQWSKEMGLQLINFTPGTLSNADYTTPEMKNYRSSDRILESIYTYESQHSLNGFILLLHIGTGPKRADKFSDKIPELLHYLKAKGYTFVKINSLVK